MSERRDSEDEMKDGEGMDPEEPVEIPIEDSIDLHTFLPREVKDLLDDYLREAAAKGFREAVIIHGKGTGALRRSVHAILGRHPMVASYREAEPERGGWGATVAVLKTKDGG